MSRKAIWSTSWLLIAAILLGACAPAPAVAPQVVVETRVVKETQVVAATPVPKQVVEFASFWPKDSPNGREMTALGYRLEAENPECDFVFTEYPGAEAYKTVSLRAQEGDPPDVYSGGANALVPGGSPEWKAGLIYDLAKDMAGPAYNPDNGTWIDTFTPGARNEMEFEGHVGMVPANQVVLALFYNKALYEQYGQKPPRTWEELMANSEVFKQNGIPSIGGGGFNGYVSYWYDNILYRLLGNDKMFALYNKKDPNIKWTDPEPLRAAEMLVDMIQKGYTADGFVGGDFAANQVAFFTGKVPHLYIGTFVMGEVKDVMPKDFQFGVTYFPTVGGYEDKTPYESLAGYTNSFGIFNPGKSAKTAHSTECAVKYLKLYSDKEVQAGLVGSLGFLSAVKGVPGPSDIPGVGDLLANQKAGWPTNQAMYFHLDPAVRTKMWDNVVLLASEQLTPQEFVETMQKDYDAIK